MAMPSVKRLCSEDKKRVIVNFRFNSLLKHLFISCLKPSVISTLARLKTSKCVCSKNEKHPSNSCLHFHKKQTDCNLLPRYCWLYRELISNTKCHFIVPTRWKLAGMFGKKRTSAERQAMCFTCAAALACKTMWMMSVVLCFNIKETIRVV